MPVIIPGGTGRAPIIVSDKKDSPSPSESPTLTKLVSDDSLKYMGDLFDGLGVDYGVFYVYSLVMIGLAVFWIWEYPKIMMDILEDDSQNADLRIRKGRAVKCMYNALIAALVISGFLCQFFILHKSLTESGGVHYLSYCFMIAYSVIPLFFLYILFENSDGYERYAEMNISNYYEKSENRRVVVKFEEMNSKLLITSTVSLAMLVLCLIIVSMA